MVSSLLDKFSDFANLSWILMGINLDMVSTFPTITWGIWKFTNLRLFQNFKRVVKEIVDSCLACVEIYKTLKSQQLVVHKECLLSWKPPPQGKIKLNFLGALFPSFGTAGLGVIVRDDRGEVLLALCRKEVGVLEVDDVEAMAALRGY